MDILGLLADLRGLGLIVELSAGKVSVIGPFHPDAVPLIATLKERKAEVIAALTSPLPVADGYTRIPLPSYAEEEMFFIEAIHGDDYLDAECVKQWSPKAQLAETARDLALQNIVPREAYRMALFAGYSPGEAAYIAKMVKTGTWRAILEEKSIMPKVDRLAALLAAA